MHECDRSIAENCIINEYSLVYRPKVAEVLTGKAEVATGKAEVATGKAEVATGKAEVATGKAEVATGKAEVATGKAEVATRTLRTFYYSGYQLSAIQT